MAVGQRGPAGVDAHLACAQGIRGYDHVPVVSLSQLKKGNTVMVMAPSRWTA